MGLFDKFKDLTKQVNAVENHLYSGKKDFLEIYERNAQLELEIEERTNELNEANRRMLTLQHIWEMMNSSKPLSSITLLSLILFTNCFATPTLPS